MQAAGLYIVELTNTHPISVNANDPRIADKCIKVTSANCKFGKAKNLIVRERNYASVFGKEYVVFRTIAYTDDIVTAERLVLKELLRWRIVGPTGRRNEWLAGVSSADVEKIALDVLAQAGIAFMRPSKKEDGVRPNSL